MPNVNDFINRYKNISFTEKPFCDADDIAFCKISYLPIENVVSESLDDEPVPFAEVAKKMFAFNGNKHRPVGLFLLKDISTTFTQMAETKRYSEMKIVGCKSVFAQTPAVQFAAATFLASNGEIIVYFRGTDDTFAGWREDIDMYVTKGVPSHKLAVDYLNEVAAKFDGDLIVLGHSKGGNVALYAALNCDSAVRDRIKRLYNNEGPGFHNYDYIDSKEYKELLPRYTHFVPNSSFFGMFLTHDEDYKVIKSTKLIGPMQHDVSSWVIDCDGLQASEMSWLGKFNDSVLVKLLTVRDDQIENVDIFFTELIKGLGQKTLTDFAKHAASSVYGGWKAWKGLDENVKDEIKGFFDGIGGFLKQCAELAREENAPSIKRKGEMLAAMI